MSGSFAAFRYLLARSAVNRVHVQLRRLKTPRYVLAMLAGAFYFWSIFGRSGAMTGRAPGAPSLGDPAVFAMAFEAMLVISVLLTWVLGGSEPAIGFTAADVQLLFPAPVTRAALVRFKLAQAQFPILFSTLFWVALSARSSPIPAVCRAPAMWLLLATIYLHRVGASFVRVSWAQQGRSALRRHIVPLAIVAAMMAATVWGIWHAFTAISSAAGSGGMSAALEAVRASTPIRIVLWPFHALVAPVFASTLTAWAAGMGMSLLVFAVCYAWVMRAAVGFEEAAMQRAERLAAQRARGRTRGATAAIRAGRPWFPLALRGQPWVAIVWKNAIAFQRIASPVRVFAILGVGLLVIAGFSFSAAHVAAMVATYVFIISLSALLWLVLFGAAAVRVDLQQDMLQLPLLRTFPLGGATIVAAEIGATIALISAMQLVFVVAAGASGFYLLAANDAPAAFSAAKLLPVAAAAVLVIPSLTALRVAVANAWAVLLPGWVRLGPERQAGIEALGQNIVTTAGSLLVLLVLLIVPGALALAVKVALPGSLRDAGWTLLPPAMALAAGVAVELSLIVRWLGAVLSRTDPSAVEAAIA